MQVQRQGKGPRYHGSQQGKPATILIARSAKFVVDKEVTKQHLESSAYLSKTHFVGEDAIYALFVKSCQPV